MKNKTALEMLERLSKEHYNENIREVCTQVGRLLERATTLLKDAPSAEAKKFIKELL